MPIVKPRPLSYGEILNQKRIKKRNDKKTTHRVYTFVKTAEKKKA